MDDKIKVFNDNKFPVGLKLMNGFQTVISPNSFTKITRDDILYISTISKYFQRGILRIDEAAKDVKEDIYISPENEVNFISDAEVRKKLGATAPALRKWLEPINERVMLSRIYQIAKDMDLPTSKVKVLQEKLGDLEF